MTSLMHRLRDLPMRRKLILVILLTCGTVLVLALAAVFVFQSVAIKSQFINDITALGRIIARNSAAAVAFNDREAAVQTLSGMESRPEIEGVCLVLANGEHVTVSDRMGEHDESEEAALNEGHLFIGQDVLFASPVALDGKRLGALYLRANFSPMRARLLTLYGETLAAVLVISLLVALALASRFQRFITAPILHLAGVVQGVGEKGDYALRATKAGSDEVGTLTDAFNAMLSQIQQRDLALHSAQNELEKRVQERTKELDLSLSLLNATLEATTEGVLSVNLAGEPTNWNSKFATIWGFPADMLKRKDCTEMAVFAAEQARKPEQVFALLRADPRVEAFDLVELKDGRIFERCTRPQFVGRACAGAVHSYRDITERTQAEKRMAELNRQLVDISRQAGMAEVASSVLHNVGNVLNSVNISLGIASDKAAKLKIASLSRLAALLRDHAGDLPGFFASHPQGPQLPAFLAQLAEHFAAEQQTLLAELGSLHTNFEHINEIVAMQQSYAGTGGMIETLALAEVIDDALRMNVAALQRHGVRVVLDLDATLPPVEADRHKILMILVNLVRNAKYACSEGGAEDKRITVRTLRNGGGCARIAVSDNGVGIPAENLARIFEHGFTTRKEGHGFGLHSSALAASEMGGSLGVQSDGPGHGATFTIELPIGSEEPAAGPETSGAEYGFSTTATGTSAAESVLTP